MKNLKKFAVVLVTLLLVTSSFALLPSVADATTKTRTVPPSEDPIDGEKIEKPKKKDLTPEGIDEYELYQEASGVYKVIIKPVIESHEESEYSLNSVKRTAPSTGAALADFISLVNTNGSVTTKSMTSMPPANPATALEIENSVNTNPTPPPPNITVNSKTFVNYGISGLISNKDIIQDAYLDFSATTGTNVVPVSVNIYDVGTAWSSATMTWATMPACIPTGSPGANQLFDYQSTPTPPTVSFTWTPMSTGTPRFDLADLFKGYFYSATSNIGFGFDTITTVTNMGIGTSGINNGVIPNLVIVYSKNEGGSPSGNDMSFGNGAGSVRVNPWAGETVYSKYDLGYSVKNGMTVGFVRTYNSNTTINYGFGKGWTSNYHQTLTVDSDSVAYWRRGNGSYLSFLPDGSGGWNSPEFTTFALSVDALTGDYVVTDKYGSKLYFDSSNNNLKKLTNIQGGEVTLTWSSGLLTSVSGDSTGRSLSFTYDGYNRLSSVTDPESNTVSFTYDANNHMTGYTDGESKTTTFIYDANDRLVTLRNPNSKDVDFTYTVDGSGYQDIAVKNHADTTVATINVSSSTATLTDPSSNSTTYTFDSRGYASGISYPNSTSVSMSRNSVKKVTSFTDAKSNTTGYTYDTNGNLTQITRPDTKTTTFTYNANNQLLTTTDAKSNTTTVAYNGNNKVSTITNDLSHVVTFTYTSDLLTSLTVPYEDCSSNTSTVTWDISYDANNYVDEVESPAGKTWTYTNDDVGRVETYTDPNSNTWTYTYDGNGRLVEAEDPYSNSIIYSYTDTGLLGAVADKLNNVTAYGYDDNSRLTTITDAESNVITFIRNYEGQITTMTDPEGNDTVYTYDSLGRVTAITNAENETVEFTYDDNSNVTKVTDPLDNETDFTYDSLNRLTKITDELSNETDFAYDDNSNLTSITNPLDKVTSMTYDDLNRLLTVTDDDSNVWSRTYLASGKLATLDGPATANQVFCYNNDGLLTSSYNSDGEDQTYTYDSAGRLTKITDALGNETDITYDNLNRVRRVYDAVDNYIEYTYDAMGNITARRDRRGNSTSYAYDDIYRVTSVTDALSNVYEYTYDNNSRVTQVEAPPQLNPPTTSFVYDDVGRLTSFTDPLSNSGSFVYNDNGLMTSRTDRNSATTSYTYDDLNRLTNIAYSLTDDVDFTYDNASRLISMVDSIGTTEWTYNDIGRLTSTDDPWDFTHALVYNAEGFITSLTCEGDARTYAWNSAGQMTSATRDSQATTFDYNAASWITDIDLPTGIDTDYTYNSRGWITDLVAKDSNLNTILDLDYTYDANGNVTSEDVGANTWSYTYDVLNRLTAVDKPGTSDDIAYTYDVRGNRTDIDVGGTDNTDLTFNIADQLTRVDYDDGSYRVYTYDDNGNCTDMDYCTGSCMSSVVIQNKEDWEERQANFNHYPFTTAPRELLRSTALNPHLPTSSDVDVYFNSMLDWTNPELADYVRRQKWNPYKENRGTNTTQTLNSLKTNPLSTLSRDYNPTVALVYDESTDYTYDKENRLTHVDLPDGTDVDFSYDGLGRRLTKVITDGTDITTIKYHYVGGQITTIEIDAEDDEVAYRDETIHIHLGPNSYPISFEWVRYDYAEETTLDDTYYYHYDLHGNVLKVTDDSEVTKITYLYDVLGEITSETNNDNIPNFFTYRGATQTLRDSELDLYFGGGFYRPDLGTGLSSGGVASNPPSAATINGMAQAFRSAAQFAGHVGLASVQDMSSSGSNDSAGVSKGLANSTSPAKPSSSTVSFKVPTTIPEPKDVENIFTSDRVLVADFGDDYKLEVMGDQPLGGPGKEMTDEEKKEAALITIEMILKGEVVIITQDIIDGMGLIDWSELPEELRKALMKWIADNESEEGDYVEIDVKNGTIFIKNARGERTINVAEDLEFIDWGIELVKDGNDVTFKVWVRQYKLRDGPVRYFWGPDASHGLAGKEFEPRGKGENGENLCFQPS